MTPRDRKWAGLALSVGLVSIGVLLAVVGIVLRNRGLQDAANTAQLISLLFAVPMLALPLIEWWRVHHSGRPEEGSSLALSRARSSLINTIHAWRVTQALAAPKRQLGRHFDIELEPRPDLVQAEFRTDVTRPNETVLISEALERAQGRLLIVGEPGSGKTILALELLRNLLNRARLDPALGIPELFSLATWARQRKSLEEWLVDELRVRGFHSSWIDRREIIPILDGLDEVPLSVRGDCIDEINVFRGDSEGVSIIVTSRSGAYEAVAANHRLAFGAAYSTRKLSRTAVLNYFSERVRSNPEWNHFERAIQEGGTAAQHLLRNPLILNMIALASTTGGPEAVLDSLLGHSTEHFWRYFVEAMRRKIPDPRHRDPDNPEATPVRDQHPTYSTAEVNRWLGWLASDPASISEINLSRLPLPPSRLAAPITVQRLYVGALIGLALGGPAFLICYFADLLSRSAIPIIAMLSAGLLAGMVVSVGCPPVAELVRSWRHTFSSIDWIYPLIAAPISALACAVIHTQVAARIGGALSLPLGLAAATVVLIVAYAIIILTIAPVSRSPYFGFVLVFWALPNLILVAVPIAIVMANLLTLQFANLIVAVTIAIVVVSCAVHRLTPLLWGPILRVRAWSRGLLPLRLRAFLEWSTDHLYLQGVGQSYRWFHPNLASYLSQSSGFANVSRLLLGEVEPLLLAFDFSDTSRTRIWPQLTEKYELALSLSNRCHDHVVGRHIQRSFEHFVVAKSATNVSDFYDARSIQVQELRNAIRELMRRYG